MPKFTAMNIPSRPASRMGVKALSVGAYSLPFRTEFDAPIACPVDFPGPPEVERLPGALGCTRPVSSIFVCSRPRRASSGQGNRTKINHSAPIEKVRRIHLGGRVLLRWQNSLN